MHRESYGPSCGWAVSLCYTVYFTLTVEALSLVIAPHVLCIGILLDCSNVVFEHMCLLSCWSGLQIIYSLDEVAFIQNLVFYIEEAYRIPVSGE